MNKKENSPRKLKQTTISGLWSVKTTGSSTSSQGSSSPTSKLKKRKGDENSCDGFASPLKKISLQIDCGEETGNDTSSKGYDIDFEDFSFEDFENNPFLSPKKSPKKGGVLTENCSKLSDEENWQHGGCDLSFEMPRRCKVVKVAVVTSGQFEQVLLVSDEKTEENGLCRLRDVWTFSAIAVGDLVVLQAERSAEGWIIDNKVGYLVVHPNVILSSTSMLKSSFCMRRGLLANFYKGIEAGTNASMVVGRLVHELLQRSLRLGSCTDDDFASFVSDYLQTCDYLHDIYFCNKSFKEIRNEVENFVAPIRTFLDVYINKVSKPFAKNFSGTIEEVIDIEELIRSPTLGFQGRIDVTVKVKSKNQDKIMPLELKTGKASFSSDHRSQLTSYILLMNEIGRKVESGLLLYLKDEVMEEVIPNRDEIRNLFLMRNRLVGYYKSLKENELPEPIRSSACMKCPYLRICTSYLKSESLYETHALRNVEFEDVKPSHRDYFTLWNKLLWLEYGDVISEEADDREIDNLVLEPGMEKAGEEFRYRFTFTGEKELKMFQPRTFVHVFQGPNRICSAKVASITNAGCCLSTDKILTNRKDTYRIGTFRMKFFNMYLSNVGLLLEERYKNLREIIIDKKPSDFGEKLDKKTFKEKCLGELVNLNKEQRKAALMSLLCKDYMLIKGPPGTGKTQTIVGIIRILVKTGKKVLITGHTNSSVDNILLRLEDVEYLRLGYLKSINGKIHDRCYVNLSKNCKTFEEMSALYDRKLIAATCSGIDEDFLRKVKFDVCIVDESSQALECEILRPLFCSDKFILVGDEDQLPPIVLNSEAKKLGMSVSLFERLEGDGSTVRLRYQYRMNVTINALANSIAYNGLIECANEEVAEATIKIDPESVRTNEGWVIDTLSCSLEKSVLFVDTSDCFSREGIKVPLKPRSSVLEANLIKTLLGHLIKSGLSENEIGVIAAFVDQISVLKGKLEGSFNEVEMSTVDQYQGRDKEVILFSCGKENQPEKEVSDMELLNDNKRLTVAVTRAKHKLILIGDRRTVKKYGPFRKLLDSLRECQFVLLKDGENGFYWRNYEDESTN